MRRQKKRRTPATRAPPTRSATTQLVITDYFKVRVLIGKLATGLRSFARRFAFGQESWPAPLHLALLTANQKISPQSRLRHSIRRGYRKRIGYVGQGHRGHEGGTVGTTIPDRKKVYLRKILGRLQALAYQPQTANFQPKTYNL